MKNLSHFLRKPEGKLIAGVVIFVVVSFAYYFYATGNQPADKGNDITINETDHVRGALDGKVTLVEFADFQCPACGAYEPLIRQVESDNKDILKVVFRHFPLTQIHQNALLAAKASEAAGVQGKFWEMHDLIYEKQTEWSGELNARDFFLTYARTIGLDTKKFADDLNSVVIEDKILAEFKEGINLEVQGTPTFFINGKKITNPSSPEEFNKIIRDAAK